MRLYEAADSSVKILLEYDIWACFYITSLSLLRKCVVVECFQNYVFVADMKATKKRLTRAITID